MNPATPVGPESGIMLEESRRLTGPNLLLDSAGAVIDARLGSHAAARLVAAWGDALDRAFAAVGWGAVARAWRAWPGGVTLAFAAPIDTLYAATEVNEWAFTAACHALDPAPLYHHWLRPARCVGCYHRHGQP